MIRHVLAAMALSLALGTPAAIGFAKPADAQVQTVRDDHRGWRDRRDHDRDWRRHNRDWRDHDRHWRRGHDRHDRHWRSQRHHGWWRHSHRQPAWRVCYDRWSGRQFYC